MHFSRDQLKLYVEGKLNDESSKEVNKHIDICEMCREFCDYYHIFIDSLSKARKEDIPVKALKMAEKIYHDALKTNVIRLQKLTTSDNNFDYAVLLAADGEKGPIQAIENLATFYSEDPEIVLRVMRDSTRWKDYLQLISDDPKQVSYVLVQIPELGKEYITDENGRATLEGEALKDHDKLKWQVKLPDALFELEPLRYDPDRIEKTEEMILETENRDKIKVIFERRTEGKQITLNILELEGKSEFKDAKVIISHQRESKIFEARPEEPITMYLSGPEDKINIRLFHK